MSDTIRDILEDKERTRNVAIHKRLLSAYLKGNLSKKELMQGAKIASGDSHGFFISPIDFITDLEKDLGKIKNGSRVTWARVIFRFWENWSILVTLYYLSPWNDNAILVRLDYESGFLKDFGVFPDERKIGVETAERIIRSKDWITNDCDKYFITISNNGITNVYWIGNAIEFQCKDGVYRTLKRPRKRKEWTDGGTMEQREKFCC